MEISIFPDCGCGVPNLRVNLYMDSCDDTHQGRVNFQKSHAPFLCYKYKGHQANTIKKDDCNGKRR